MVAPNYAEKRRELAKKIGLGRAPGQKRGRRKKTAEEVWSPPVGPTNGPTGEA